MEVARRSGLNPWAEPYVPGRYLAVEDYSPEWWELVASSAAFRNYWLRDRFRDPQHQDDDGEEDDVDLPDGVDDLFYPTHQEEDEEEKRERERERSKNVGEVVAWGMEKWVRSHGVHQHRPKFAEKAPKIVNVRPSPRTIQQPR